ncbi:MAG: gliding motility-associated C-terminal domain-containing protein [Bacteroidia bacterium]
MSFLCISATAQVKFRENKGQWEEPVKFRTSIPGGELFLEKDGLTYSFYDESAVHDRYHNSATTESYSGHAVKVKFQGANAVIPVGYDTSSEYYNYFLGNDPTRWASGVKAFGKVIYRNIYDHIDLEIVAMDQAVKYNFIVNPGGDPDDIALLYSGGDELALQEGALTLSTSLNKIVEQEPYSYQIQGEQEKEVKSGFRLKNERMQFKVGRYNKSIPLVIDPLVVFSTFSGSVGDNFGFTATYDDQGNGYGGGTVYEQGYPVTAGAYQQNFKGPFPSGLSSGTDAGIMKLSPDGKQLLYATYLGGSGDDRPHSMVVNSRGELIILGTTSSFNFPTSSNAFNRSLQGGTDIFVSRISADGKTLLASTLAGGHNNDGLNGDGRFATSPLAYNYGDQFRGEVITDQNDNVLIASCTESSNFPVRNAFQGTYGGGQDGVVLKLTDDLDMLLWSSFIGGNSTDAAYGLHISADNELFVCGGTKSNNFKTTPGVLTETFAGGTDGFVAKINALTGELQASTFLGTNQYDQCYFVQLDGKGQVYAMGQTKGIWPVTSGVYSNNNGKQFITVLDKALSTRKASTVFGTGNSVPDISPSAFLVDLCGRVYVSGWGGQTNNTYNQSGSVMTGMPLKEEYQTTTDGSDFYLIILSRSMKDLVYATYFGGGRSSEHVDGGTSRFDKHGKVYQSVCAGCGGFSDFPTTEDAWSQTNNGKRPNSPEGGCNNALFKIDLNSSNFAPEFRDTIITVMATEKIDFSFMVTDKDPYDSVFFSFGGPMFDPDKFPGPHAKIVSKFGISSATGRFTWQTSCDHITNADTLVATIYMRDDGCPTPRTSEGTIKIVVQPPPPPAPPAIFCLKRMSDNNLELNWGEFETGKYVSHYNLLKRYPDGRIEILKEIRNPDDIQFLDKAAPDHANVDYCYLIHGVNICGMSGDSTRWECSIPDEDSLPPSSYIYTVTVVDNDYLKLVWQRYSKDDYYMYKILRKKNNPDSEFEVLHTIKNIDDTTFFDYSADVHNHSYCYVVTNVDQCFLQSASGNFSCSIHLSGESVPFEHYLDWNKYEKWKGGVREYEVIRRDPYNPDSVVIITEQHMLQTIDKNLNLDVGLYWYRIIGHEGDKGLGAESVSNEIELVQAPELYVPNVFSPNDDESNDLWNMVPVFVKDFEVKVYNRWGERVFHSNDRHDRWNGTYKDREPFDAVFVYIITYTGWDESRHHTKGTVTIIR